MTLLEAMEARANNRIRGLLIVNMIVAAWLIYTVGDQVKILQDLGFDF
jgi:hypothetical protein